MKLTEFNLDRYKHILKNGWNLPENLIKFLKPLKELLSSSVI